MSLSLADVNAEALEAVWTLDTPAGPLPLAGGQVSLDRSWTPALQSTVDYDTHHPLAAQVEPLTRDPLVLRLRTQTAGLPILDDGLPPNLVKNGSFENALNGWTLPSSQGTLTRAQWDQMAGLESRYLAVATASGDSQWIQVTQAAADTIPLTDGKQFLAVSVFVANDTGGNNGVRVTASFRNGSTGVRTDISPGSFQQYPWYEGGWIRFVMEIPDEADNARLIVQMYSASAAIPAGRRLWIDQVIAATGNSADEALAGVAKYKPASLGDYEWPEDTSGARVNQVAYWVYPRSTRESRSQGRTSVELASADLLLVEQRNGSAEPWIAPPSRIFGGDRNYAMTRTASQLIVHAGLRVTVGAQTDETSPEREPTWEPGDNVWGFIQGLLQSRYEWRFDPKINAMSLLLGSAAPEAFESAGRMNAIDSTVTRGDSTELGTLDFADGLLITWQWEGNDGATNSRLETVVAAQLDSWRDVTKWAELTINSAPQTYGARLLDTRAARIAQGTHTLALDEWSIDDLGIAYWDGPSRFQTLSFSVDGGTYTITSPLQEA